MLHTIQFICLLQMRLSSDNQTMEAKIFLKKREANHVSINKIVIIGLGVKFTWHPSINLSSHRKTKHCLLTGSELSHIFFW